MYKHLRAAALVVATALPAAAQQNLEYCAYDEVRRIQNNLATARQNMAVYMSDAAVRAGRYDCIGDMDKAQRCVAYAHALAEASQEGQDIFYAVTAGGCYSCDPARLWGLAYDLKQEAERLRDLRVYSDYRNMALRYLAEDGSRNVQAVPKIYFINALELYQAMQTARVKGTDICPATGFDPTAAGTRGTGQAAGMSDDSGTAPPTTLPLDPSIAPPAGLAPATGAPPQQRCSAPQTYEDRRLNSGFGWVIDNMDFASCAQTCSDRTTCTGYDYNWSAGRCVIRSEAMGAVGLEQISGWTHYECQ